MEKKFIVLPEIKLLGITCKTRNTLEMDPSTAKIPSMVQTYFQKALAEKITHRKSPGTTYSIYTNYESDFTGEYTYFMGEEVHFFKEVPEVLETLTIPLQYYVIFTVGPGKMPDVCIEAWQQIWRMTPSELGGERSYLGDFELYDARSLDPNHTMLDICIGIKR